MRGRTNVTQRSGLVPVNGDVINAEVVNSDITIGDFVSYGVIENKKIILNNSDYFKDSIKVSDTNSIVLIGNVLYLIEFKNDDVNIISTYNDYLINCITLLQNGEILCSIQEEPYIIKL